MMLSKLSRQLTMLLKLKLKLKLYIYIKIFIISRNNYIEFCIVLMMLNEIFTTGDQFFAPFFNNQKIIFNEV